MPLKSNLISVTYSEEEPTEEFNSRKAVGGAALGGTAESGGGGGDGDSTFEAAKTCWYLIAVLISRNDTLSLKGTTPWEVDSELEIPTIPLFGGIEGGNIVKACLCLSFWEKVGLYNKLKSMLGDPGFKMMNDGKTYAGWELTKECKPCGSKISGKFNKACPCDDKKSIDLNNPHNPTNQNIDSGSTKYVASDGTSIVFSAPGNFESVMGEIAAKEKSIPLKCKGKKGGDPK